MMSYSSLRRSYRLLFKLFLLIIACTALYVVTKATRTLRWTLGGLQDPGSVRCRAGSPCQYPDEVDLRIIVMTFNRPDSLKKCLSHVRRLDTMGDEVRIHIWIDRPVDEGEPNSGTLEVANQFAANVSIYGKENIRSYVHVQETHVGIFGQWVHTWPPRAGSREIGLLLEDDIDISPFAYRWLKAASRFYGYRQDISGYSIKSENLVFTSGKQNQILPPNSENAFLYGLMGTWGFAPHPNRWREFQDWVTSARASGTIKPYVPNTRHTGWYKKMEREGTEEGMWEMWHIYFSYLRELYCLYNNLGAFGGGRKRALLSTNRREAGLHFDGRHTVNHQEKLLTQWNETFIRFDMKPIKYSTAGAIIKW